eukprot:CAMPEP_0118943658 /NCGR_PEP_ID=MMETSP1169-20130426/38780_1 /TAXON_ID=36882 /ORGANISM="Pyramimonas obovata, Strain CCMP722" /LENGTH=487 /DNA_ID=CAMNT_0006888961 /DNA_START=228 /DNA_END=1688 /DNA_ORIENTATION=-
MVEFSDEDNLVSDEEDAELSEEYLKLQDQFAELCRRLKLHDSEFCTSTNTQYVPAPLSLAEDFEELAAKVLAMGADPDDCQMCLHFAVQIRKEHALVEEREERLRKLVQEEVEQCDTPSPQKPPADVEALMSPSASGEQNVPPSIVTTVPSAEDLRAMSVLLPDAAPRCTMGVEDDPFPLLSLPDEAIRCVMAFLRHQDVGRAACACSYLRDLLAQDETIWQRIQTVGRRHPPYPLEGSWKVAFSRSLLLDESWRQRRNNLNTIGYHSEHLSCVHLREDLLIAGSGDHTLSLTPLLPRATPPERRRHTTHNNVVGVCIGHRAAVSCCQILNGARALSASVDGELRLWDIENVAGSFSAKPGAVERAPCIWTAPINEPVDSLTFDVNARPHSHGPYHIACGGSHPEFGVRVFAAGPSGIDPTATLYTAEAEVYQVQWASGEGAAAGRVFAACTDSRARAWDLRMAAMGYDHADTVEVCARGAVRCLQV